jgi:hypothetical protein
MEQTKKIMDEILPLFASVQEDWKRIGERQNAAAGRRIRTALDTIAKKKIELRKAMLAEKV